MAQSRMADGCRNVVTGALVATGGGVGSTYGGAHADPTGVADSTQAFRDALTIGQSGGNPIAPVYVPSGTYLCSGQITQWVPGFLFGEPSAPPTITLKANSMTGSPIPFWTTANNTGASVNNTFHIDLMSVNFIVQSGNSGCSDVVYWAVAQRNSIRDVHITRQDGNGNCLHIGGGGGGGTINFVTTTGGILPLLIENTAELQFRGCTFNGRAVSGAQCVSGTGPQNNNGCSMMNFVACTFNNSGQNWGDVNWTVAGFDDCTFNCIFPGTGNQGDRHMERCTINGVFSTQQTFGGNGFFFNRVSESGTSANIDSSIRTAPLANPPTPYPSASCVNVLSFGGNLATALASNSEVYCPPGNYSVGTLTLGSGQKIFGPGTVFASINGTSNPTISTTGNGSGNGVTLAFLQIYQSSINNSNIIWNADPNGSIMSSCQCVNTNSVGGTTPSRIIVSTGGLVIDEWWMPADSNNSPNNQQSTGLQINSSGGVYGYGFQNEHYSGPTILISGASNVYLRNAQFEQGNSNWTAAQTNQIINSTNISYNACLAGGLNVPYLFTVSNSQASLYVCHGRNGSYGGIVFENGTVYGVPSPNPNSLDILNGFVDFTGSVNTVPSVLTSNASSIAPTTATLNGNISSNGGLTITSDGFDYGTTTSYGTSVNASTPVQSGVFSVNITGLTSGTTYHFRAKAVNSQGTGFGLDNQFRFVAESPDQTVVNTVGPTITDANGGSWAITSGGQVSLNGSAIGFTSSVIEIAYVNHVVWQENSSLQWFSFNSDGTFLAGPTGSPLTLNIPTVSVNSATVGATTAVLSGNIVSTGAQTITADGFDWGPTNTYGTHVASTTVQSGSFSFNLSGLTTNTTYHYRATADNASGRGVSTDQPFTPSSSIPVPTLVQHAASASNNNAPDGTGVLQVGGTGGLPNPGNPFHFNLPNPAIAGNCLILMVSGVNLAAPTITDNTNAANTWTLVNSVNDGTTRTSVFVALNVAANTQRLVITFSAGTLNAHFQCSEFYNVTAVDGSSVLHAGGSATVSAGTISAVPAGDLIWMCGVDTANAGTSANVGLGWAINLTNIASGVGCNLLAVNLFLGTFCQYSTTLSGNVNATATLTGTTDAFNCISVALRSGSQGSAPAPGIRIIRSMGLAYCQNKATQFPSTGNLIYVGSVFPPSLAPLVFPAGWTKLSDPNKQAAFISNINSPNLSFLISGATTGSGMSQCSMYLYDVAGAAASPFDHFENNPANGAFNTTGGGEFSIGSVTPTTPNGLVFYMTPIGSNLITQTAALGPGMSDNCWYGNEWPGDEMSNADGYAHLYNTTSGVAIPLTTAIVIITVPGDGQVQADQISCLAVCFKAAAVSNTVPSVNALTQSNVTSSTATLNGSVTGTGGQPITQDGFHWGTTTAYGNTALATTVQSGNFSSGITGLTNGQIYHYQSFAVNSVGTGVSTTDVSFIASPPSPFIQGNVAVGGTSGAVLSSSVTYLQAQTATNSNVVAISFNNTTAVINSVVDTQGKVYQVASPLIRSATDSQAIYWCPSILSSAPSANSITVALSIASSFISMRAAEYNGLGSIDVHSEGSSLVSGIGLTASVPSAAITNASDLVIAAANSGIKVIGPASGFVSRLNANPFGSDFEDDSPGVIQNFTAPISLDPTGSATNWVENLVAFFPAGVVTSIPSVSASASNVLASSATLNGLVVSTGNSAILSEGFDYGTTVSYGTSVAATTVVQSGSFTANISGLTGGTFYHFRSKATNAIGQGVSTDQTFQFIAPPLTVPGSLTATPTSISSITLTWTASTGGTGAIHYEIWSHAHLVAYALKITTAAGVVTANDTGLNAGNMYFYEIRAVDSVAAQSAFSTTISAPTYASFPGSVFASNYNVGGQNVGYFDNQGANIGTGRSDGVDLKATSDAPDGSGFVLGFRAAGEWTKYNVTVASSGTYTVAVRYESAFATGQFHILDVTTATTIVPSVTLPATGPFDTLSSWVTVSLGNVTLSAGDHVLQVLIDNQFLDFNFFSFSTAFSPGWLAQLLALKSASPSGGFTIVDSAIPSLESFGLPKVIQPSITLLSGVVSSESFGALSVPSGNVSVLEAPWIFNGVVGTPLSIGPTGSATVSLSGIATTEAFGLTSFSFSTVIVSLSGIVSTQAFGFPTFQEGNSFLFITSVPDSSTIGTLTIFQTGAQFIFQPVIISSETFGTPTLVQALQANLQGIPSAESFGIPTVNPGNVSINLSGQAISSQEAFGVMHVVVFGEVDISLAPVLSAETFGALTASGSGNINLPLTAITSLEVVNNPGVTQPGGPLIIPARAIDTLESFGFLHTALGIATISLSGVQTSESFGIPRISFPGGPTHMGRVL